MQSDVWGVYYPFYSRKSKEEIHCSPTHLSGAVDWVAAVFSHRFAHKQKQLQCKLNAVMIDWSFII